MYHLDGSPAPSDQTLFTDLLKITTAKWQAIRKGREATVHDDEASPKPTTSRTASQLSVPKVKE
ncbi:hypothetical protein GQ44DRAFT_717151 [Phaeosphaeriaceae sp. PMI808]|nr:hypothetical protein GQ44DRAFT_717151 [Phaeosphaeriaceae sp. PMI808]